MGTWWCTPTVEQKLLRCVRYGVHECEWTEGKRSVVVCESGGEKVKRGAVVCVSSLVQVIRGDKILVHLKP